MANVWPHDLFQAVVSNFSKSLQAQTETLKRCGRTCTFVDFNFSFHLGVIYETNMERNAAKMLP